VDSLLGGQASSIRPTTPYRAGASHSRAQTPAPLASLSGRATPVIASGSRPATPVGRTSRLSNDGSGAGRGSGLREEISDR
jgi:hypothetical protein